MFHEQFVRMNKSSNKILINEALNKFIEITGATVRYITPVSKNAAKLNADAEIEISIRKGKQHFYIEAKNELRQLHLPAILKKIHTQKKAWILLARYIPVPVKEELKWQNINYVDLAGNCYINAEGLFLYINDRPVTTFRQRVSGKLWTRTGLKFLFVILSNPELLNENYRTIAAAARIALGNIGPLISDLKEKGYAKDESNALILIKKEILIAKWVELFQVILRPSLKRGRFRFLHPVTPEHWEGMPGKFLWGGEPAANYYTGFISPELFVIYSDLETEALVKDIKILPDINGKVEVLKQFWSNESLANFSKNNVAVPPLLVYADLLETGDSRNGEVALRIKNKYLND
jgi:hypothetical protein